MQKHDVVIALDNKPISDHESLVRSIGSRHPGEKIALTIRRGGKTLELKITLDERPEESSLQSRFRKPPPNR